MYILKTNVKLLERKNCPNRCPETLSHSLWAIYIIYSFIRKMKVNALWFLLDCLAPIERPFGQAPAALTSFSE